jgi:5-methylcytosine-specific restriction protein A
MAFLKKAPKAENRSLLKKERKKVYSSARWENLRQSKLMYNPLCEFCLALDRVTPATEVHHMDSFLNYTGNMRLAKAYDMSNLISLCSEHHGFLHRNGTTHGLNLEHEVEQWLLENTK